MGKYRTEGHRIGAEVVVTIDPRNRENPFIVSLEKFAEIEQRILDEKSRNSSLLALQRMIVGYATVQIVDENGCIDLSDELESMMSS